jgi:hypothetical protein
MIMAIPHRDGVDIDDRVCAAECNPIRNNALHQSLDRTDIRR